MLSLYDFDVKTLDDITTSLSYFDSQCKNKLFRNIKRNLDNFMKGETDKTHIQTDILNNQNKDNLAEMVENIAKSLKENENGEGLRSYFDRLSSNEILKEIFDDVKKKDDTNQ